MEKNLKLEEALVAYPVRKNERLIDVIDPEFLDFYEGTEKAYKIMKFLDSFDYLNSSGENHVYSVMPYHKDIVDFFKEKNFSRYEIADNF